MQTIIEEDDEELKMYERESMLSKQNLRTDSTDNKNERQSNDNKNRKTGLESNHSQEINRFSNIDVTLSNAIEAYQEGSEKESDENNNDKENNNEIKINDDENNQNVNEAGNEENKIDIISKSKRETMEEYKIIVLGDFGVGKSSLIYRYLKNSFKKDILDTIKSENNEKIVQLYDNKKVKLNIWDTAGEEKDGILFKKYYIDVHGVLLVFDLTNKNSFDNLKKWIQNLKENCPKDIVYCFVGNKSDLNEERKVSYEEAKEFSNDNLYYEASSKNGNNVSLAFEQLTYNIIEKQNDEKDNPEKELRGLEGRRTTDLRDYNENDLKTKKKCC